MQTFGQPGGRKVDEGSHLERQESLFGVREIDGSQRTLEWLQSNLQCSLAPLHIHSEDYWGVVISGVAVNGAPGTADVALPVGSYWFQKGGERHVTKCISPNECIFFVSQQGKFDYVPTPLKQ